MLGTGICWLRPTIVRLMDLVHPGRDAPGTDPVGEVAVPARAGLSRSDGNGRGLGRIVGVDNADRGTTLAAAAPAAPSSCAARAPRTRRMQVARACGHLAAVSAEAARASDLAVASVAALAAVLRGDRCRLQLHLCPESN